MIWVVASVVCIVLFSAELLLRINNSYRLQKDAFDESIPTIIHPTRGWASQTNFDFTFYHRYLKSVNNIRLNRKGLYDEKCMDTNKNDGTFRILIMGDTVTVGWEVRERETMAAQLEQLLKKQYPQRKIEVINAGVRLYSTGQLYFFYNEE